MANLYFTKDGFIDLNDYVVTLRVSAPSREVVEQLMGDADLDAPDYNVHIKGWIVDDDMD